MTMPLRLRALGQCLLALGGGTVIVLVVACSGSDESNELKRQLGELQTQVAVTSDPSPATPSASTTSPKPANTNVPTKELQLDQAFQAIQAIKGYVDEVNIRLICLDSHSFNTGYHDATLSCWVKLKGVCPPPTAATGGHASPDTPRRGRPCGGAIQKSAFVAPAERGKVSAKPLQDTHGRRRG